MEPLVLNLGKLLGLTEKHRDMVSDILKVSVVIVVMEALSLQVGGQPLEGLLAPAFLYRVAFQALGFAAFHLVVKNMVRIRLA